MLAGNDDKKAGLTAATNCSFGSRMIILPVRCTCWASCLNLLSYCICFDWVALVSFRSS